MKSTIEQLQDHAKRLSRRAVELRKRSAELKQAAINGSIAREDAIAKVTELTHKADEESKQATNVLNFLRRFEDGIDTSRPSHEGQ